jgi:acetyl-CoA carboxylase biotin carboxylase subunit
MPSSRFRSILVANRGEIALRVIRSARELGLRTVAVYSDPDRSALHVRRADLAVGIGGAAPRESYLDLEKILDAARRSRAEAIHPGYGFLSENAEFAGAVERAGLVFIGPPATAIAAMGDKLSARRVAAAAGVQVVPGHTQESLDEEAMAAQARELGFPVMLKAVGGGGGKGIRVVGDEQELRSVAALARAEARHAFSDGRVYLEKLLVRPRHVEVQVFADEHGNAASYGERECSVQRRHQKLIEESPSCALDGSARAELCAAAVAVTKAVGYRGAGTIEFLWSEGRCYFLEMNTRLQVEHPITEERFGVDLVKEQIRVAAGLRLAPVPEPRGHAIEVRVNAEDPDTFLPALGRVTRLAFPGGPGVRMDSALYPGLEVSPHYDSLLAKLVVHAPARDECIARMERALAELVIGGVATSIPAARRALRSPQFRSGDYDTGLLASLPAGPPAELRETFAVAAAVVRMLAGSPRQPAAGGETRSPWVLSGRLARLGGFGS